MFRSFLSVPLISNQPVADPSLAIVQKPISNSLLTSHPDVIKAYTYFKIEYIQIQAPVHPGTYLLNDFLSHN